MLKNFLIWGRVLLAAAIILFTAAQSYAAGIGRFQFVIGDVVVTDASGRTRTVAKGDELNEGDTIGTSSLASAQLRMVDGAFVAVRPDSKLKFDQYRYNGKEDGTERGLISLLVGGLRTVTGVIGRTNHANYTINTPTATIGIRGTDHETVHIPAPDENGESIKPIGANWPLPSVMSGEAVSPEELRDAVRLAQAYATQSDVDVPFLLALEGPAGKPSFTPPAGLSGPPGTYNKVNSGATTLTTQAGTTFINANQVGYAASRIAPAVILPKIPEFFKATGNPGDRRQQQAQQGQGQGQGQGQQTAGSGGSGSGGGQAGGGEQQSIRTVSAADSGTSLSTGGTGGTTTGGTTADVSTGSATGGSTGSTGTSSPTVVQQITVTGTSGQTVNLTTQTTTPQGGGTPAPIAQAAGGTGQYRHQFIFPVSTTADGYAINQYTNNNNGVVETIGATATGNAGTFLVRANRQFTDPTAEANTNFLLDSSGNLVKIASTPYRVQDRSNDVTATQSGQAIPSTSAMVSISGATVEANTVSPAGFPTGVTVGGSYTDAANNVRLGRDQGGTITVHDPTLTVPDSIINLGNRSAYWAIREVPPTIPVSGDFMYTPVFATRPSDSLGNLGTLNYASLTAHFSTMTVDPAVSVTVNNQTLTATGSNIPLSAQFGFNVSQGQPNEVNNVLRTNCFGSNCATAVPTSPNLAFGCTGATGTCGNVYSSTISGGLAGANGQAGGASFAYEFDTRYNPGDTQAGTRPTNDYITGSVAFTKGTPVAAQSLTTGIAGQNDVQVAYSANGTCGGGACTQSNSRDYQLAAANPFGSAPGAGGIVVTNSFSNNLTPNSLTLTAGTPAATVTGTATGITLGRYTGATVGADNNLNGGVVTFPATVLGSFNWANVPNLNFPSSILVGTATYTFDKGFAFDQNNIAATSLGTPALAVNFNSQSLSVTGLNIAVPANPAGGSLARTWAVTANNIALGDVPASFQANTGCIGCLQQTMSVKLNGGLTTNVFGGLSGALGAVGLSGAGMTFAFSGFDTTNTSTSFPAGHPEQVSGAAAFALTSFSTAPNGTTVTINGTVSAPVTINGNNFDYGIGMVATGLNPFAGVSGLNTSNGNNSNQLLSDVQPGIDNFSNRVTLDNNGNPIRFDGKATLVAATTTTCTPPCTVVTPTVFNTSINATFSIRPQDFTGTLLAGTTPATVTDFGRDPQTGIAWGRYAAGSVAVFERISGAPLIAVDVSTQNWHFINAGQQNGAVLLPTTGTFNYTFAGGTHPTDNLGNVGTLTAQSLTANFSAQTVSASVTAAFAAPSNTGTWVATTGTAVNPFVPIQQGVFFQGQTGVTASNLTATVNGSSTGVSGNVTGIFAGNSGQGAMVGYSVNKGGIIGTSTLGTTITGVAAFRR